MGIRWTALALANIICFILLFIISYYSYFKYKTIYTSETKYTAYCSQIVYDRPDMFWKGIIPKHITPLIAAAGFSFLYMFVFSRAVVIFEWLYISFNENWWKNSYFVIESKYFFGRLDIVVGVIVAIIGYYYFLYKEFKKQLNHELKSE